jgi:hypothetical protein
MHLVRFPTTTFTIPEVSAAADVFGYSRAKGGGVDLDLDIFDSTIHYKDSRGYEFVAISDSWKRMCLDLPCSKRVVIPGLYKQQFLHTQINGQDCVIQAWKGHCPQGYREMPGGIGGEVGIYRTIKGKKVPDELAIPRLEEFPLVVRPVVKMLASRIIKEFVQGAEANAEWWWPHPELNAKIEMRLVSPDHKTELFSAEPFEKAGGYWMSRWMTYDSYARFVAHETQHENPPPLHAYDYHMDLQIGDQRFHWGAHDSPIKPA